MQTRDQLLRLYLQDHLAGATAGTALAHRLADQHRGGDSGRELAAIARDIDEDHRSLLSIMSDLDATPAPIKRKLAAVAERLGRLKPNGVLWHRSPLSTVIELEMMRMGVEGKSSGWRTLREIAEHDDRLDRAALDKLVARAEDQARRLEQLRIDAVPQALLD